MTEVLPANRINPEKGVLTIRRVLPSLASWTAVMFALLTALAVLVSAGFSQPRPAQGNRGMTVRPAEVAQWPGTNKRFALVIGVDEYQDKQITELEGATNDAKSIASALVQYAGFPNDQVTLLASDQPVERWPTRGNILRKLSNLRTGVPKDGLLLVAFAGHGIERDGKAYLLPSDAQVSGDVALLEDTAINVDEMRRRIIQTGVGQVVLILDACRNDPTAGRGDSDNPLTKKYVDAFNFEERNREITAFATLYATEVGRRAYEYTEKKQGYFTWALVQGLKGEAANDKGEVTLGSLIKYLQEAVPKRIGLDLGAGKVQRPFAVVEGYKASELIVAKTAAAETVAVVDPASIERNLWDRVQGSRNLADFQGYLKKYPDGMFAEQALWETIQNSKNPDDFKEYLKQYPGGRYARYAQILAEDTLWERIKNSTKPVDYKIYLKEYPSGRFADLANRRLEPEPAKPTPPVDQPAPKPANGILLVLTDPPVANVTIKPRTAAIKTVAGQSADGKFRAELPPGVYDVEVTAARHKNFKQDDVKLDREEYIKADLVPMTGSIQLGPVDSDAAILLDDRKPVGVTRNEKDKLIELLDVPAGIHRLRVSQRNFSDWSKEVEVEGGKTKYVPTEFKSALVSLTVRTEPDAEIYIDDNYSGRANEQGEIRIPNISPGVHRVKAKKNEYDPAETSQSLAAGAAEVKLALNRSAFAAEFADSFIDGLNSWTAPKTWQATPGKLNVRGAGIGLMKDPGKGGMMTYKDFRMEFDVSFVNGKGAVWILRAGDDRNFYLFQITGPNAQSPNIFRSFISRDGQMRPLKAAFRIPEDISRPNDTFHIIVEAKGGELKQFILLKSAPKATTPQPFSVIEDRTFSYGGIGFGALDGEDFLVRFVSVVPVK
jgi:hypothetical protein